MEMVSRLKILIVATFVFSLAMASTSNAQNSGSGEAWEFYVQGNGWIAALDATTTDGDNVSLSFKDILDHLDFTVMGGVGARKGPWSLKADLVYLALGDGSNKDFDGPFELDSIDMNSVIVTVGVGYTVVDEPEGHLDLLVGGRYMYLDTDLDINTVPPLPPASANLSTDVTNIDGIVGFQGDYYLTEQVFLPVYADIGTGDSDLTWQVFGGLGYRFENVDAIAGYRHLAYEFDDNAALKDMSVSGPIIGVRFSF